MKDTKQQPTVRQINAHLFGGSAYCYVDMPDGSRLRISRARTRYGVVEGRVICWSHRASIHEASDWAVIPADAVVELS